MEDTLELHFNDISQIRRPEEVSAFVYNNPADESSLTTAGFLNQLKDQDFGEGKFVPGKNSFRSRRGKMLVDSPNKNYLIESQIGKLKDSIGRANMSKMDMTISKQRYCSKETVKGSGKFMGKGSRYTVKNRQKPGKSNKKSVKKGS